MVRQDHLGEFRVGDLFPPDREDRVLLLRFLVAGRALVALIRADSLLEAERHSHDEVSAYLMIHAAGAAREAAKAFTDADEAEVFGAIERDEELGPEMVKQLERLREDCEWRDGRFVKSFLKVVRDSVGFHWDAAGIRELLEDPDVRDADLVAVIDEGEGTYLSTTVPIAGATAIGVLRQRSGEPYDELIRTLIRFQTDIFNIADAAYGKLLEEHGVVLRPVAAPNERQS